MYLVVPYSLSRQQKAHAEILNRFVLGEILVILARDSCKIVQIQVFEALCCKSTRCVCEGRKTIHLRGYPGQGHTAEPTKCLQRGPCVLKGQLSAAKINSNPAMVLPCVLYKVLMLFSCCQGYNLPLFQNLVSRVDLPDRKQLHEVLVVISC